MPPKLKALSLEEADELRKALDTLMEQVMALSEEQKEILTLTEEIKQLHLENSEKDKRIAELERRLDELEQHSRINNVIVTGLKIKPRSYARAVATDNNGGEPGEDDVSSTEQQVVAFLQSKSIAINADNIEACHPLPRRRKEETPAVILRFANRKHKSALLKQSRKLKGSDVYMNNHLTRMNGEIARKARQLKKQNKIQSTWVRNYKIFIKLKRSPEEAKVLVIKSLCEMDKFE